ncbi:MAG: DivIVA domain-containing protein [Clostridia bacterium]|nr:DivIVA domain-containing protein [Clostridia bacterium]
MAITVQAIESKEFKIKRLNGYDPEDVDIFLDEICDFIIALQEEKARLQAQLNMQAMAAPVVPAPYPYAQSAAPVPPPFTPEKKEEEKVQENSSEAAQKLLARAQKVYDDTIAEAKREAALILSGAKQHNSLQDLEDEKAELEAEIDMLKAAARDYRNRFLRLVEDQQHVLNSEKALFDEN